MKIRNGTLLAGMAALALCGPVLAHESSAYGGYAERQWSGNASAWGSSQGHSGWSGSLGYGSVYGYAPGYIPWLAAFPSGHRHGPACHHPPRHGHYKKHWKAYKHGRGHRHRHGSDHRGHH